jgi:hypothetical protein
MMVEEATRHAAMQFEAVKVSMSQDKNGVILRLNVHPNDCPKDLHTDWVGSRYMVVMVKLTDDDQMDTRDFDRIKKMVASAGLLCRNLDFQDFMVQNGLMVSGDVLDDAKMEAATAAALCEYCGIVSRADLAKDEEGQKQFEVLRQSFKVWKEKK